MSARIPAETPDWRFWFDDAFLVMTAPGGGPNKRIRVYRMKDNNLWSWRWVS